MTTKSERWKIYDAVFGFMIKNNIQSVPMKMEEVATKLGAEIVSISGWAKKANTSRDELLSWLGSNDGVTLACHTQNSVIYKIIYNDSLSEERTRFTIMEECAHIILGHANDSRFSVSNQSFDLDLYQKYEDQARIAAGLLLCPPQLFFRYKKYLSTEALMEICDISNPCAETRRGTFLRFESEIKAHPLYSDLPTIHCKKDPNSELKHLKPVWSQGTFSGWFQIIP